MQTFDSFDKTVGANLAATLNPVTVPITATATIGNAVSVAANLTLTTFDAQVLNKVSDAIGVRIGGADVWNPAPELCDIPVLVK
jgi:hypothetical protein